MPQLRDTYDPPNIGAQSAELESGKSLRRQLALLAQTVEKAALGQAMEGRCLAQSGIRRELVEG